MSKPPIPNDNDITKTQLWQRTVDVQENLTQVSNELLFQLSRIKEDVASVLNERLEENKGFIRSYDEELQSRINEFSKEVRFLFQSLLEQVKNLNNQLSVDLKKNIQEKLSNKT